jgi:uncharacterized membrane protein (DUF485 family)
MPALLYLEWRYAINNFRAILRSPQRLLVWVPYLFFIVYFGYARVLRYHGGHSAYDVLPTYATTIAGAYLGLLGSTIALSAAGRVAAFRSPTEAVLFSNAGVRPITAAIWLQVRKIAASPMRWLGGFLYLFAIAAPRETSAAAIVRSLVVVGLVMSLVMGTELPIFLLARRRWSKPLQILGWTIAAVGGVYGAAGLIGYRVLRPLVRVTHVDPGAAVHELLAGNVIALTALVLALAGLAASVLLLGDDSYPELYAASRGPLAGRARRIAAAAGNYAAPDKAARVRIPGGALSLVWKDWIAFRRGRGTFRLWIAGCVGWAACGAASGFAKNYFNDVAPIVTLVTASAALVLVIAPFGASIGLASDLSKPLFWLGASPLRNRIAAWTLGRAWRGGFLLGLAPAAAGVAIGAPILAMLSVPVATIAYWSLQSLGVGLYAIFPNPIDARGPMLLLRLVITTIYVSPAILTFAIVSITTDSDVFAALIATAVLALQGYGVVELASYRFREYGASLATIAQAT